MRSGRRPRPRWPIAGLGLLLVLAWLMPARAQSCTADVQCPEGGRSRTYCAGNTLVTVRSICSGTCRTVEDRREPCPGACVAERCVGGPLPPPTARPGEPACVPACSCRNGVLAVTSGVRTAAGTCERTVRRCPRGCVCEPVPRCR